jgi:hypothetical protein
MPKAKLLKTDEEVVTTQAEVTTELKQPQGAIPRGNPTIKGIKQDLGNGMFIKYN